MVPVLESLEDWCKIPSGRSGREASLFFVDPSLLAFFFLSFSFISFECNYIAGCIEVLLRNTKWKKSFFVIDPLALLHRGRTPEDITSAEDHGHHQIYDGSPNYEDGRRD